MVNLCVCAGVKFRERQSWSEPEESDITCSVVMERCSMNPKANVRTSLLTLPLILEQQADITLQL